MKSRSIDFNTRKYQYTSIRLLGKSGQSEHKLSAVCRVGGGLTVGRGYFDWWILFRWCRNIWRLWKRMETRHLTVNNTCPWKLQGNKILASKDFHVWILSLLSCSLCLYSPSFIHADCHLIPSWKLLVTAGYVKTTTLHLTVTPCLQQNL